MHAVWFLGAAKNNQTCRCQQTINSSIQLFDWNNSDSTIISLTLIAFILFVIFTLIFHNQIHRWLRKG